MHIKQFKIASVRNLAAFSMECTPQFNWIYGKNGSGKSSLLEGLYLLSTGRSFRTKLPEDYIQKGQNSCFVSALIHADNNSPSLRLGLERRQNASIRLHMNEEPCHVLANWVKNLVLQLINTDSYHLLDGSPNARRSFLDWAMFHVEPSFFLHLQRYRRALKQRNAALKKHSAASDPWAHELFEMGTLISKARQDFLNNFMPTAFRSIEKLLNFRPDLLKLEYSCGWNKELGLDQAILRAKERDNILGYTSVGPHRADFQLFYDGIPVESLLSRGQMKLFITALYLARADFVANAIEKTPICLLDDFSSELDSEASLRLLEGLARQKCQVFITSIESPEGRLHQMLLGELGVECRMFHVEQGRVAVVAEQLLAEQVDAE